MATKDLSASILVGSEEIFQFSCQPCSTENLHMEAVGYFQECCEYLCDNCFKAHRKLAATKHHQILDKMSMSKSKLLPKVKDVLTETCPKHRENVLEYFCNYHNQICCSVCLTLNHASCSNKIYIPDVSGNIASIQEYSSLMADLDRLVILVKNQQKRVDTDRKYNERLYSEALANIKQFREQINKVLDKLEEDTVCKLSSIEKENSQKIAFSAAKIQNILSEINNLKSDLKQKETDSKHNQLFVTSKLSQGRVTAMGSRIDELSMGKMTCYSFDQDEKITQMMSSLSAIWSLSVRQGNTPTTARYVREINVKSEDDPKDCKNSVKMIYMDANKFTFRLSVSSTPFAVTKTKTNHVAVALGNERKIEIIIVSDVLTINHTIDTPGAVIVGLCYNGSNFITACQHPDSVKVIDMSGRTLQTFTTDKNGKVLFTKLNHIAISREKDVIYVTDMEANTVTCMTTGGHVISVYKHTMLMCPHGVLVAKDGTVYVCSQDTHTVHQLSPTGDLTRILLGKDQGLASYPTAMAYSDEDHRLYISSKSDMPKKCNFIRLYQLE